MSNSDTESDNNSESTDSDIESEDEYTKTFEGQFSLEDLEKLIKEDGIISYDPICVRKRSNWSTGNNQYKFDNPEFSPEKLLDDIHDHSPKLHVLLDKIEKLDKKDMQKYGKKFKHFIFSDLKSGTYGAKLIAGALMANGMKLGYSSKQNQNPKSNKKYDKIDLFSNDELMKSKGNNFYLLSSVSVYDQPITTVMKKSILKNFNERPTNTYGDLARIIVMDSGFKEGIDLFDIKYIHIYEPSVNPADQKQVIGRGTRTCGQKGLEFHPTRGWPLYVYVYDLSIPEKIRPSFLNSKTTMDLYLKALNIDVRLYNFAHELEKTAIYGSVDYELNRNIHMFSIGLDDDLEEELPEGAEFVYGGDQTGVGNFDGIGGGPKLRIVSKEPKYFIGETKQAPPMNFEEMRNNIRENYSDFAWDFVKMENLCKQSGGASGEVIKYTPTQDFIRNYFTPMNPIKGMLLWHSVGTGKTCSAIAAATNTFEKQGYTILWVTRTTLKNDIWKNMFDQVCNESIRNSITHSGLEIPNEQNKRMRLLSKSWRIRPMSYKQFSNLVSKQNSFYKSLVKQNGELDPLNKTLLIIDEAHKLYGGGDLSSIERPDMNAFHQALMNSYQLSGPNSVKLLLMTATPITENPMELIQLINLCKPIDKQLPNNFDDFSTRYLDEVGEFTTKGREHFLDDIAGHISYLNREKDARQFAQPIIEFIDVPIPNISQAEKFDKKIVHEIMNPNVNDLQEKIAETNEKLQGELSDLDKNKFKFLKNEICNDLEGKSKSQCEKIVNNNIKMLVNEAKAEVKKIRDEIKEMKEIIKERNAAKKKALGNIKINIETLNEEYEKYKGTTLYSIKNNCGVKISGDVPLKTLIKQHPIISQYDNEISEYNEKIQQLHNNLKIDINVYKQKINNLKNLLKTDLNDLEKRVVSMNIRDARKTQNAVMKIKNKEMSIIENSLKEDIKKTQKKKDKKYKVVRKTIKHMIKDEKRNDKERQKEEKKLLKLKRQQEDHVEEIKHELLQGLVHKYKGKIMDDMVELDERMMEKETEKENARNEKEQKKEKREREKLKKEVERLSRKLDKEREKENKKKQQQELRETKKREKLLKANARKTKKNN
uniref:Helicase ATP-binding domain-containing protein n=1 Tax=viral metagenome TaxID=1070528 RepID=A0A6C0D9V4_9ZZZZ